MKIFSGLVVAAFGLSLIALAGLIVFKPTAAKRFINFFASSAWAHYTEQVSRLIVGVALVDFSRSMRPSSLFNIFGWLIVVTAVVLLLVPWRWHNRFATWAIPFALRHLKLYAAAIFALGLFILYGWSHVILP